MAMGLDVGARFDGIDQPLARRLVGVVKIVVHSASGAVHRSLADGVEKRLTDDGLGKAFHVVYSSEGGLI